MKKLKIKSYLFLSGSAAMLLAPVALAASCGSNSASQTNNTNQLVETQNTTIISNLRVLPSSTHDNLQWPQMVLPESITACLFYAGAPMAEADALQLSESQWTTLPTQTSFDHASRSLWMKIVPAAGYQFEKLVIDVTKASGIDAVKSKVDAQDGFDTLSLSNIKVLSTPGENDTLSEVGTLPTGAVFKYDTMEAAGINAEQLRTYLTSSKHAQAELQAISVYLVPSDETKFLVVNSKRTLISVVKAVLEVNPLDDLTITASGNDHLNVKWLATDSIKMRFIPKYLYGNFATEAEAMQHAAEAVKTVAELPKKVDPVHENRSLWILIDPIPGYAFTEKAINATEKSQVRKIRTMIDDEPAVKNFNASDFWTHNGKVDPYLEFNQIALPKGLAVRFHVYLSGNVNYRIDFDLEHSYQGMHRFADEQMIDHIGAWKEKNVTLIAKFSSSDPDKYVLKGEKNIALMV